jgi:hypothetical protein
MKTNEQVMEKTEKEQWVKPEVETIEICANTKQLIPPEQPEQS